MDHMPIPSLETTSAAPQSDPMETERIALPALQGRDTTAEEASTSTLLPSDMDTESEVPQTATTQSEPSSENADQPEQSVNADHSEQSVNADQPEQSENADQSERSVNADQPEQSVNADQPEQSVNADQSEQSVNADQSEQSVNADQPEQSVNADQPEQSVNADQPETSENGDLSETSENGDLSEQSENADQSEQSENADLSEQSEKAQQSVRVLLLSQNGEQSESTPTQEPAKETNRETEPSAPNGSSYKTLRECRVTRALGLKENELFQDKKKTCYRCEKCCHTFASIKKYYVHRLVCQENHSPDASVIEIDNWCSVCREHFPSRSALVAHHKAAHQRPSCDNCRRSFSSTSAVLEHQRISCVPIAQGVEVLVNIIVCPNCRKMFCRRTPPNTEPLRDVSMRALCITCVEAKETEMNFKVRKILEMIEADGEEEEEEQEGEIENGRNNVDGHGCSEEVSTN